MARLTKKGAQQVTADLDRIANLVQSEYQTLGIPQPIADDFAKRIDMVSDAIERQAGITRQALTEYDPVNEPTEIGGWDPEQIGEEVGGPLRQDGDEAFMKAEFTQQEKRELRERQTKSELGPTKTTFEPQKPTPGVQASFKGLMAALKSAKLTPESASRIAKALNLATTVVTKSAGEMPPQFKENAKKKQDEAKEKDDKGDDEKDEKEAKKASHGYNLFR